MDLEEDSFYALLPELSDFREVVSTRHHRPVPDSWYVVITDVQGSTQAIEEGRYKDVNALGVASIIALRNAVPGVEIPFVFGGDGATLLVPGGRLDAVQTALRGMRALATESFQLTLRASCVSVALLKEAGHSLLVGRYRQSPHVVLAALSGSGVSKAEEWVKDPESGAEFRVSDAGPSEVDLTGFECRWQPAESRRGTIVSLLIVAVDSDLKARESTYRDTLEGISSFVGDAERPPLSKQSLRLSVRSRDFSVEARVVSQKSSGASFEKARVGARNASLLGRGLLAFGATLGSFHGATYKDEFLANTDFRKFDEAIRMVLDMTREEVSALDAMLLAKYQQGRLAYGMHLSSAALITCMVRSYSGDHVHFVDGSDGGYALAAKQLKAQLKRFKSGAL